MAHLKKLPYAQRLGAVKLGTLKVRSL